MSSIEQWNRNSFGVSAVQITEDNLREVAEWCSGRVLADLGSETPYIALVVGSNESRWVEANAYIGDWIIIDEDGRQAHYNDENFRKEYKKRSEILAELKRLVGDDTLAAHILNFIEHS